MPRLDFHFKYGIVTENKEYGESDFSREDGFCAYRGDIRMAEGMGKRILLVEEDASYALAKADILEQNGYSMLRAESGLKALQSVRDDPGIALVLMDLDLEGPMDGVQTAQALTKERNVPILFLSGHTDAEIVKRTERIGSYGVVSKSGGDFVLLASVRMALKLFDARMQILGKSRELEEVNRRLRESEAEFRGLFDASPAGICLLRDRVFRKVNAALCELTGYSEEELIGQSSRLVYPNAQEYERVGRFIYSPTSSGRGLTEAEIRKKDGQPLYALIAASPLDPRNPDSSSSAAAVVIDITERKRAEEKLQETEAFLYRSQEIGRLGSYILDITGDDPEHGVWRGSPMMDEILGIGPDHPRTLESWLSQIVQRSELVENSKKRIAAKERFLDVIYQIIRPSDGTTRWIRGRGEMEYDERGFLRRQVGTIQDITDQIETQNELDAALHEQQTLFRELQHRVKNSLTLITSLVGLEMGQTEDPRTLAILAQLSDRVRSLASLYDLLSRSQKTTTVRLDEYIHTIIESLASSYLGDKERIRMEEELAPVELTTKSSAAWGLIANELLTNALKYAFPDGRSGTVRVHLHVDKGDVILSVSDDGKPLPEGFDLEGSAGLGLNLTAMMAQQLGGELSLDKATKTFRVRAPVRIAP